MEHINFTQLSPEEIRKIIREELQHCFQNFHPIPSDGAPDIGTIELAEEITGLKRSSIYGLVQNREIPHMRKGKRLYFNRSELIEWIEEGRVRTAREIEEEAGIFIRGQKKAGSHGA